MAEDTVVRVVKCHQWEEEKDDPRRHGKNT